MTGPESSVVEWVKAKHARLVRKGCNEKKSKCRLVIDVQAQCVVLDGNKLAREEHPVCDCLIFAEGARLALGLVESKDTVFHVNEAIRHSWRTAGTKPWASSPHVPAVTQ